MLRTSWVLSRERRQGYFSDLPRAAHLDTVTKDHQICCVLGSFGFSWAYSPPREPHLRDGSDHVGPCPCLWDGLGWLRKSFSSSKSSRAVYESHRALPSASHQQAAFLPGCCLRPCLHCPRKWKQDQPFPSQVALTDSFLTATWSTVPESSFVCFCCSVWFCFLCLFGQGTEGDSEHDNLVKSSQEVRGCNAVGGVPWDPRKFQVFRWKRWQP